jgi:hypothetical protein
MPMHDTKHIHGHFDVKIHGGVFHMTQATGSFSLTVSAAAPPPNPPVLTPSSGALPGATEGVAVVAQVVTKVSGGVPPYTYAITGVPAGLVASEVTNPDGSANVQLDGTPSAGDSTGGDGKGNYNIGVNVTDSAPAGVSASRTLNVGK